MALPHRRACHRGTSLVPGVIPIGQVLHLYVSEGSTLSSLHACLHNRAPLLLPPPGASATHCLIKCFTKTSPLLMSPEAIWLANTSARACCSLSGSECILLHHRATLARASLRPQYGTGRSVPRRRRDRVILTPACTFYMENHQ